jgi:radical SAM protein with 4Fe4S-binding SPASM domain
VRLRRRSRPGGSWGFFPRNDMANLSITRRCRRHCNYCFAKNELARGPATDMPPEVYEAALGFLERSGIPEARLLGGEPTEHPRFCEYVSRARERGFRVVVFSGGLIPEPVLEYMAALPAEGFLVVLNAADPTSDADALVNRQRKVCRALGARLLLGVNIRSVEQDPGYLFDWVTEYGLCRTLRVGIAHPIWGGTNDFFQLRGPRVIPIFERLAAHGERLSVNVGFDCGFTPCMFSSEFVASHAGMFMHSVPERDGSTAPGSPNNGCANIAEVSQNAAGLQVAHFDDSAGQGKKVPKDQIKAVGVRCNAVVDILPEGDCIACYALSRFRRLRLPLRGVRNELVSAFDEALLPVLPVGVHRECGHCDYRTKGMCGGGCRARRALRLRPNPFIPLRPEPPIETPQP